MRRFSDYWQRAQRSIRAFLASFVRDGCLLDDCVQEVALDPRGSWRLGLNNGAVVVVGRSEARARLDRFVRLLPQLLTQNTQQLARADLRYTNGFALTWKPAPTPVTPDAPQVQGNT